MNRSFFVILLLHVELIASKEKNTEFQRCWQKTAPDRLWVEGCSRAPCKLIEGTNFKGEIHFTTDFNVKTLKPKALIRRGWFSTTLDTHQKDGCQTLKKGNCPLNKDDSVIYTFNIPIRHVQEFSGTQAMVEFYFLDDHNRNVVCLQIPVRLIG